MPRPLAAPVLAATDGDLEAVREHILEATHRVIDRKGLAAASTRAIAEEAGVAGGTLYNYFDNHTQLLAKAIVWYAAKLSDPVASLPSRAGKYTVAHNLRYFVRQAATVLDRLVPAFAAAFSNSQLLEAVRREMAGIDPLSDPARVVERYLLAERDLGRVAPDAECRTAASIIVSLCHDDAYQRYLYRETGPPRPRRGEIDLIARSLTKPLTKPLTE
ncbi:MAG TPA: helix-turn-helix domain-containing protein [Actinomycetota bacterium]